MSLSKWEPVLEGELAEAANSAIQSIADDVLNHGAVALGGVEDEKMKKARDASLAGGIAGKSVFFTYLAMYRPDEGYEEKAVECLEESIGSISSVAMSPGLYSGFPGVAWATEHLQGRVLEVEEEDPNAEIDQALGQLVSYSPWQADYDLISGVVGMGLYGLERMPKESGRLITENVLERLSEMSKESDLGISWHTDPRLLPPHQREQAEKGYYNVGLAHGIPGVTAFLSGAAAFDIHKDKAMKLLEGSIEWLKNQDIKNENEGRYPYWVGEGVESGPSRWAWCYGDPGVCAAYLIAGELTGRKEWTELAVSTMKRLTQFPDQKSGVLDPALCHGAIGLAHIFNRMYQVSGDEDLKKAAVKWYEKTLDFEKPGEGVGGFFSWQPGMDYKEGDDAWVSDPGFLTGSAGIGLGLLAAVNDLSPDWDRILLCSVPTPNK